MSGHGMTVSGPLAARLARALAQRWPRLRRELPRDLLILLWLVILSQAFGLAWVMTDSVHTSAALVLKGVQVEPGQLAVFGYAGRPLANYYPDDWSHHLGVALGAEASRDGPRRGDGFVKYLIGVAGDRIEVVGRQVFLHTRRGRLDMGRCKPVSRHGVPLTPITSQVIPEGFVYMWAPHADALDSRYELMGLVPAAAVLGRAVPLW